MNVTEPEPEPAEPGVKPDDAVDPLSAEARGARVSAWDRALSPRDDVERFLVGYAAELSLRLELETRVADARAAHRARLAPAARARAAALRLERAMMDLIEPTTEQFFDEHTKKTARGEEPRRLRHPRVAVLVVEATSAGCRGLVAEWRGLGATLEGATSWGPAEARKAIRLLGKLHDDSDDPRVREFQAAMDASGRRSGRIQPPGDAATGHDMQIRTDEDTITRARGVCRDQVARLEARAVALEAEERAIEAAGGPLRDRHDSGRVGRDLRRSRSATHRELVKTLDTLAKLQKRPSVEIKGVDPNPRNTKKSSSHDVIPSVAGLCEAVDAKASGCAEGRCAGDADGDRGRGPRLQEADSPRPRKIARPRLAPKPRPADHPRPASLGGGSLVQVPFAPSNPGQSRPGNRSAKGSRVSRPMVKPTPITPLEPLKLGGTLPREAPTDPPRGPD